jgi:Tol biopolymer transport system component
MEANIPPGFPQMVSIQPDGRYVVFASLATNLVAGDTNATWDIFLRDRSAQTTACVSVADGVQGNGGSIHPSLSADGRFIACATGAARGGSGGRIQLATSPFAAAPADVQAPRRQARSA